MRSRTLSVAFLCTLTSALTASAQAPSGAIFTTVANGSEVNYNIYPSKDAVYLDGGPGPGAPATAAGLDDGTYVFQVTIPSSKVLLSTDKARCRQFTVFGGLITDNLAAGACRHVTGFDLDHGATTVQLMPYKDTTNNGGVYKAWAVRVEDYLAGCAALGVPNGLDVVDCGYNAGNFHGFVPSHSKTDNFKVRSGTAREIDTRFFNDRNGSGWRDEGEEMIDGLQITWIDPTGGSNVKSSYYDAALDIEHEAHVEAVENGVHRILIANQPGCTVGAVYDPSGQLTPESGPQQVSVELRAKDKSAALIILVSCTVTP